VLEKIYILYYDRLLRYGCAIGKDEGFVHDQIQELFLWLLLNPEQLQQIEKLDVYLFSALRKNLQISSQKNNKKEQKAKQFFNASDQQEISSPEENFIIDEEEKHRQRWLIDLIDQLSLHQKEMIYLRFLESLSYTEIASMTGTSEQIVRNSVFRAMKKLRQKGNSSKTPYRIISLFLSFLVL
jgi:RNA polymerase sigma-70 factor (ECF subfamily)